MVALPDTGADRRRGHQLHERLRLLPALLPVARDLLTGQHATTTACSASGARRRLRHAQGRGDAAGLAGALQLPLDPHRQDAERLRRRRPYVPPGWGPFPTGGEFYGFLPDPPSYTGFKLNENGVPVQYLPEDYQTDVYADKAVDRIGNHFTAFPNRPLYMEVQFFARPGAAGDAASAPSRRRHCRGHLLQREKRRKPGWLRAVNRMGPGLISKVQTRYRNRLETLLAVDEAVSAIVELEARGVLGETYIVFTSDNGYMQGQHRLHQGKFVAYDPSAKVPLLIRGPGIPAGSVSKELVSNVDIVPTILDAAGAQPGVTQDGRSLLPSPPTRRCARPVDPPRDRPPDRDLRPRERLSFGQAQVQEEVDSRQEPRPRSHAQLAKVVKPPKYRAIRTGRYLLIKYSDGGRELYDMPNDPLQVNSVWKNSRYFPVRKFLLKKLAKLSPCTGTGCNAELKKPPKPCRSPRR